MSAVAMSDAGPLEDTDPAIDKSIRLYRELGFSSSRIAAHLIRTGHPSEEVHRRFPDVPLIELPSAPSPRSRQSDQRTPHSPKTTVEQERVPRIAAVRDMVQGVLERVISPNPSTHSRSLAAPSTPTPESAERESISFQYVPLIQCSFPHADPGELTTTFSRRNGWLELTLSSTRTGTGLPYGVPARLLTIYCASEAIRTRSPEIFLGSSVHDFLRRLEVPITRGERGSLRVYSNQLLRLIHCSVSIDENIQDARGRTGLHIRQALFVDEARLWWDEEQGVGHGSSLILSSILFQSILERSAPLSTRAIRQLRKSPMDLDVYAWLVHRLFHLNRPSTLTWAQLSGQFGHNYGELRYFRRFFNDSLKRVQSVYPEARVKCTEAGLLLLPSKPHIERRTSGGA